MFHLKRYKKRKKTKKYFIKNRKIYIYEEFII